MKKALKTAWNHHWNVFKPNSRAEDIFCCIMWPIVAGLGYKQSVWWLFGYAMWAFGYRSHRLFSRKKLTAQ